MTDTRAMWTYYKGEWREGDVRILGAASQATWLGSLVFDGARLFEGVTPDLDRHSARANDSARALGLEPTLSANDIEALAREGLKKFAPDFALCLEAIPMVEPKGFTITTTSFRRPYLEVMPVNAKAACLYPNNARMLREAKAKGFHNALVTDVLGNVAETATSNVFMVRGGEVFTPVLNGTFLNGITRQRVIKLLREAGVSVHETTLKIEDFREADEIFSTGNMSKVVPIIGFDERKLDYGLVTKRARALYWEWAHA
ncbi:branched-chain amino acid aminotransferase [Brucella melitensis]|uniref:branched-chain amino acid aminotransferase n=1 Tax=Brucella melitensis TaxID=29459 RepID=UPI00030744E2|nr:branched-chain amino acid aminotransferase [Brucella melitensis]